MAAILTSASQFRRLWHRRQFPWCVRRHWITGLAIWIACFAVPATLRAATIQAGDVTLALGPTFFLDEAANGGGDADIHEPNVLAYDRSFSGLLTRNQGATRVTLTGFGFAAHTNAAANDATSVAVTFTYLGADELPGGGDDVVIGTATGTYNFTIGGEYVFAFDAPLTADLTITGTLFRIQIAPTNAGGTGSLKMKTPAAVNYQPKLSVAGFLPLQINPGRLNLAKFQSVTTDSLASQRPASYVTDGVSGNDNRWQSQGVGPHWARVDFPFPVEIGSAQLCSGSDDANPIIDGNIQYLSGSTWVNIPGAVLAGNTNVERNFVFDLPVTASSFRVYSPDATVLIRELALYPSNGPSGFPLGTDFTHNLAYQHPVVASASTAGNYAMNAVDGRASTYFWKTATAGTNTLDIDLRVSTKIGSAHLYSGSIGVSPLPGFVLKYWDGSAWQNIPGATVAGNSTADLTVPFTTPVTTSQVRLEFTNPGTTSIRELCIFPANTGNTGYPIGTNITETGAIAKFDTYNDAFYQISNPSSSRFIAVASGGQPALDQAGLTTAQGQYQVLLNLSNGTYRLRNRATGKCLSGAQLSKTPGEALSDAPYSALPHQDWILDPLGAGAFHLINQWSGLVIDTQGAATSQGTPLIQATANSSPTQRWQFAYSTYYPKKGIGNATRASDFQPKWVYNWGRLNNQTLAADASFYPMQWGNYSWDIGSAQGPIWQEYSSWRKRADNIHLLAFNEPDSQSNVEFNTAITLWPRMQSLDLPLVSPAPASMSNGWLASFYTQAETLGYRVDYTALHTYPSPNGGSSDNLVNFLQTGYNNWQRPIVFTEFSFADWYGSGNWSEEDNYQCLAEFLWRAESLPYLRKYALFPWTETASNPQPANPWQRFTPAPRSNSWDIAGNLTAFGKLYAAWDSDTTVRDGKSYILHHKGSRKRLANLLATGPDGRTIRVDGSSVNWSLAPSGTAGRYHVVSSRDGRRLSSISGAAPTLAIAGSTGPDVEWTLTEFQYGWYYLGHPASSKRLQLSYNNTTAVATYSMVANTTTGDPVLWRFVVPAVVENTAPVLAAIPPQTANQGALLTFTASATDTDLPANTLTFSLVGAPVGASINSVSGVFTWTPTVPQGPGTFNFTVRVSDGNLTNEQAVSVTVAGVFPSSEVDTDGDGLSDLLEYAFLTDPGISNGNPFRTSGASAGATTLEFPWNWQATRISWQLRHGQDLSNIAAWPVVPPGPTTITRDGTIDRITVSPTMAYPDHGFYVLKVIGN